MSKRVLILSTSAGSGHKSAAAALEKVFTRSPQAAAVVSRDALDLTNDTFRNLYSNLFLDLVKRAPRFIGWWYDQSDEPWRTDDMRLMLDRLNATPIIQFIEDFRPDVTVCTHFMPAGIIADLVTRGRLNTTLSIVTTDYDFHSMWLTRLFNRYFVALDQTKAHLKALGLPEERITVSGIPVDPAFGDAVDRAAIFARYQLDPAKPILLLSAGAVGGGPALAVANQVLRLRNDVQTVIICGRNERLRRRMLELVAPQASKFRVLGYTTDMAGLMQVATLFVGKPGGLTSAEAMAAGVPMLIGAPIPGQEERNSDHLLEQGVAVRANDITVVAYKIDYLLDNPEQLEEMRRKAQRFGRPHAAQLIVETVLNEPLLVPYIISEQEQERMVAAIKGYAFDEPEETEELEENVLIYDCPTGVFVGAISEDQLRFLQDRLEEESADDKDYYLNHATVDILRQEGAGPGLISILEQALGARSETEIRWMRRA